MIASGAPGGTRVSLLACTDGRTLAAVELDAPLAASPALAADASAVYAATKHGELLRLDVPGLAPRARVRLAFEALALAAAGGPDAIVLVGGRGTAPLSAHEPASLATLQRYAHRDGLPMTVSALHDNPGRQGFVVGFADLPETWEIVYDRAAPPVLLGFVHDYRNNEAVPLPGRLTARPFKVASPTQAFAAGPVPWEIARIDADGRLGVLSLELRREIERPALAGRQAAQRIAAWRRPPAPPSGTQDLPRERILRGWVAASTGSADIVPMQAVGWRPQSPWRGGGEVLAMAPAPGGGGVLVAHRDGDAMAVSILDPANGAFTRLHTLPAPAGTDPRFVPAAGAGAGCTALLDREGRWLAALEAPPAPGSPPLSRPGSPPATSSAPPTR